MSLTRTFLPASGALSLGAAAGSGRSITERFGGSTAHSMSEYYGIGVNTANATLPASGPLRFSDFYNRTENITTSRTTQIPGPGQPFVPASPAEPAQFVPAQSGSPSVFQPGSPGQPNNPSQPSEPAQPSEFGQPFRPGQPFNFGQPTIPGSFNPFFGVFQPTVFGQFPSPGQPSSGQPFVAGQPFVPGQPFEFGQPFFPSNFQPGVPSQPGGQTQPFEPAVPEKPAQPGTINQVTEFLTRVAPEPS